MQAAPTLTTARLTLRMPKATDLPAYTAYCASERSRFVRGPFTAQEAFDKFAAIIGHWTLRGFGRYVMEYEGRAIGHVGPLAVVTDTPPELTWTLWDGTFEGRGFATEAAQAVKTHLFEDLGWPEMLVLVQPENIGSRRIAEKVGARKTDEDAPAWYPGCLTYRLEATVAA
ncbi:GNAT family N-acetyltransferase [Roseobacter sinensis]|uniref:GNAT family N-acetyltransferase n=1 Tax=Roseobacter sinensis TaxID=2931391 RepID=A0ABT3BDZ1_9RHOB|nr:GNAT family N-acetyltransferase [Roseobacter sp. WL0113]MCV3271783.1 GNAT family N-acetyltransferase [Roseobacter sp. WL0113]